MNRRENNDIWKLYNFLSRILRYWIISVAVSIIYNAFNRVFQIREEFVTNINYFSDKFK